jgi:PAS domain S-box-containing protein
VAKPDEAKTAPETLREKAEAVVQGSPPVRKEVYAEENQRLIQELEVRQIELEMQNEELRTAQAEREASRSRYYDLYDLAPVGYFTLDEKGLVLEVNLAGAQLLGVERRSLVGQSLVRFVAPDSRCMYSAHRERVFSTRSRQACELRLLKQPVASVYVRMESVSGEGVFGEPSREWTVLTDITDRKRAEQELLRARAELQRQVDERTRELLLANRVLGLEVEDQKQMAEALLESEMQYSTLVENALVGIMLYQDAKVRFVNRAFADIWGYPRDEILEMDHMSLVYAEDRAALRARGAQSLKGKELPAEYELRGVRKDGHTLWLYARAMLIIYEKRPAVLINVVDITRQKEVENSLRSSERELRILSSRLLSAQDEERRRIGRDLHDVIGQSLSAIKFRLENAISDASQDLVPSRLDPFKDIVPIIADAIGEIRRIEKGLWPSVLDGLGLRAAISWLCREFRDTYAHITLETEIEVDEEGMSLDVKAAVFRIIQEALNNTAKYSQADQVFVSLIGVNGGMGLAVWDTGVGFDTDRVLENPTIRGLGLTSMKERAELTGGSLTIESAQGRGASVFVTWPGAALRR